MSLEAHTDRVWKHWTSKYEELRRKPREAEVIRLLLEQDVDGQGAEALEQWERMTMVDLVARLVVAYRNSSMTLEQAIVDILRIVPNQQTNQIHNNLVRRGFKQTNATTIRTLRRMAVAGLVARVGEHPNQHWRLKA